MENIIHEAYVNANIRLNELINIVTDEIISDDPIAIEFLEIISIIEEYEKNVFDL